jgi:hypothetical protein
MENHYQILTVSWKGLHVMIHIAEYFCRHNPENSELREQLAELRRRIAAMEAEFPEVDFAILAAGFEDSDDGETTGPFLKASQLSALGGEVRNRSRRGYASSQAQAVIKPRWRENVPGSRGRLS